MTLNPLQFTEQVIADFLRNEVTAYPLAGERLSAQLRALGTMNGADPPPGCAGETARS